MRWWRDGEDSRPVRVFRYDRLTWFVAIFVGTIALGMIGNPVFRHPAVCVVWGLLVARGLCERRRALLLSERSLTYRPAMNRATQVPWDQVERAERFANVGVFFLGEINLVAGFRFTLRDGTTFGIPLDFTRRSEVGEAVSYVKVMLADRACFEGPG